MDVTRVIIINFLTVIWSQLVMSEITSNNTKPVEVPHFNISKVVEGGGITISELSKTVHKDHEHMIKINKNTSVLPPFEIPEKNDDKKSVPRKGVTFTDLTTNVSHHTTTTTTTKTTTVKLKKKKPTITEADDAPYTPLKNKPNITIKHGLGIEDVTEKQKKPDYIVPIVVVILFVPLLAIIISVLYKHGSEWWQHRHYRRMDFLIEGMYNN